VIRSEGTFDSSADVCETARPEYPEELFDDLIELAGLDPGDRLLEIGCATGKEPLVACAED
jgi:cyclopropane fatty-acyl-phospholipid synthase-like methyltransferase